MQRAASRNCCRAFVFNGGHEKFPTGRRGRRRASGGACPGVRVSDGHRARATTSQARRADVPRRRQAGNCTIVLTQVDRARDDPRRHRLSDDRRRRPVRSSRSRSGSRSSTPTAPTAKQDIHFLDATYGGTTQAAITVLRASRQGSSAAGRSTGESSPIVHLQPVSRSGRAVPAGDAAARQARRRGRAVDPDVGAGADVQPADEEVRLPPEPRGKLPEPGRHRAGRS